MRCAASRAPEVSLRRGTRRCAVAKRPRARVCRSGPPPPSEAGGAPASIRGGGGARPKGAPARGCAGAPPAPPQGGGAPSPFGGRGGRFPPPLQKPPARPSSRPGFRQRLDRAVSEPLFSPYGGLTLVSFRAL